MLPAHAPIYYNKVYQVNFVVPNNLGRDIYVAKKQSADDQLATALQASMKEFSSSSSPPHFAAEKEDTEVLEQVNQLPTHWHI